MVMYKHGRLENGVCGLVRVSDAEEKIIWEENYLWEGFLLGSWYLQFRKSLKAQFVNVNISSE